MPLGGLEGDASAVRTEQILQIAVNGHTLAGELGFQGIGVHRDRGETQILSAQDAGDDNAITIDLGGRAVAVTVNWYSIRFSSPVTSVRFTSTSIV